MLGYLPYVVRNIRVHSNRHCFVTFTSGFTAVTNMYMLDLCRRLEEILESGKYNFRLPLFEEGISDPWKNNRFTRKTRGIGSWEIYSSERVGWAFQGILGLEITGKEKGFLGRRPFSKENI